MLARVKTTDLMNALGKLKHLAKEAKGNKIFANVHVKATETELTLTAMNTDAKAIINVPVHVEEPEIFLVDASKLYDITATFKGEINLEYDNEKRLLYIKQGKAISQLPTVNPAAYPITRFKPESVDTSFTLPCEALTDGFNKAVLFADTRGFGILSGVNLTLSKNKACIIGCDGARLVEVTKEIDNDTDLGITLPSPAINSLTAFLQDCETVRVEICGNLCIFYFGENIYYTKILEGIYPQIKQLLREKDDTTYTVDKSELKNILERIKISELPEDKFRVNLNPEGCFLHISSPLGKVEDVLAMEKTGDDVPVTLNRTFLTTVLNIMTGEKVTFGINNPHTGVMFNEANTRMMIMPMG